ncbi:strB_3_AF024602 [Escherichia coli]|nr:strB_3_AF024602 [Escherichia coli]
MLGRENNLMLLEYAGERMLSHIVAEHGDYQATEIAAELMAKLYAASEEPLPFSRSGIALQLCFSGRAMIKTQVVKLTTSTRRL